MVPQMQVENWNNRGSSVSALEYNSTVPLYRKERIVRHIACGDPLILYTTPESLLKDEALRNALQVRGSHSV
jgi:superfamily II DNA helicase RecQ